ncbi:phosphomevalonate kinase [Pediococcus argentinicus]|uniref:phosphomevalonate kinase n=1 Tax=Pediococcus argentinicus TaxID=480391 RepID=UPI00070D7078|nr:phosphomevalonate kinase [Pediococcus argentinicus]NKZ21462.1 phosphomevalonate kinase [Pediococcus argentinicus]GEP18739.1 phosphomevalonate kinase [Pediococcus argentinicus]
MLTEQAPGKLYIAGEYAIVEPGHTAIIVALNQFVTASIKTTTNQKGRIISEQYQNQILSWRRNKGQLVVDERDNPYHYILSAIAITEELAVAMGKKLLTFDLSINSDLDNPEGKKYGLGSSAAVTVATIKVLAKLYQIELNKKLLFKLAAIAHLEVQGNGSLGDVAASVYGGWIAYQSFNRDWLNSMRRTNDLKTILEADWPLLKIELLDAPKDLELLIGWTGSPASTSNLVDQVASTGYQKTKRYDDFLQKSEVCIQNIIKGFHNADLKTIQNGIIENRALLHELTDLSGVIIETPALVQLCSIADSFDGASKSSGAGGGDCGIVIINSLKPINDLLKKWVTAGIQPLKLDVHHITDYQI